MKYVRETKIYVISNESARAPEWPISDVVYDIFLSIITNIYVRRLFSISRKTLKL